MKIRHILMAGCCLLFWACQSTPHPEGKPLPAMTFGHLQSLPLNVRQIDARTEKTAEAGDFILSPARAAKNYFDRRFTAAGARDSFKVVINRATVTSAEKGASGRVTGYLGVAGHTVYDITLDLTLQHIEEGTGRILYSRGLKAQRTMNITEHASVAEREKHQFQGMEEMFAELDTAITEIVLDEMKLSMPSW